jgi:hypothetical protein
MRAWVNDALGQVKSRQQLHGVLQDLCTPYEVIATDVSCDADESGEVVCNIRLAKQPAANFAEWLGISIPGSDSVVLKYQAHADFRCC